MSHRPETPPKQEDARYAEAVQGSHRVHGDRERRQRQQNEPAPSRSRFPFPLNQAQAHDRRYSAQAVKHRMPEDQMAEWPPIGQDLLPWVS